MAGRHRVRLQAERKALCMQGTTAGCGTNAILVGRAADSSGSNENAKEPAATPTIAEQEADCFRLPPVALRLKLPPDLTLQLGCDTEI